jgi:hypothetical protein
MVRVGLWGAFDVEDVGDMLVPRIIRAELSRRLPGSTLRVWSPLGGAGWNRFDDPSTEPPAPLGTWSAARLDELAGAVDLLVISGDLVDDPFLVGGLGAANEASVPSAWHAVSLPRDGLGDSQDELRPILARRACVSVRDERSRDLLVAAGVDREVAVVPDPVLLADRLFRPDALEDRVSRWRDAGALPDGDLLVVQGGGALVPHAEVIAEQVRLVCEAQGLTPVLVETSPTAGDEDFAVAIGDRLPGARRLPSEAGIEGVCAVIAWSAGVIGSSRAAGMIAAAFDRPAALLDPASAPALADVVGTLGTPERLVRDPGTLAEAFESAVGRGSIAPRVAELRMELDEHLDAIAALATSEGSVAARLAAQEAASARREEELRDLIEGLTRQITEGDIRFVKLWRKIRECDKHYAWQFERAEAAEELTRQLQGEVAWLTAIVQEYRRSWVCRGYMAVRRRAVKVLRLLHVLPPGPEGPGPRPTSEVRDD